MVATADRSDHDDEEVLIFFASFFFLDFLGTDGSSASWDNGLGFWI